MFFLSDPIYMYIDRSRPCFEMIFTSGCIFEEKVSNFYYSYNNVLEYASTYLIKNVKIELFIQKMHLINMKFEEGSYLSMYDC